MSHKKLFLLPILLIFSFGSLFAQGGNSVKVKLVDSLSKEPVGFATVYVSKTGEPEGAYYALTDENGAATIVNVKKGTYFFVAEMMGYKMRKISVNVDSKVIDMGTIKMKEDVTMLDQVVVSAVGNPITVKKDTIEYNAASFKTTDNDMLEELLKKLPGVEIGSDGSITANGQTITKITIDGKTFFLDDPQLATKNIPAKIIQKVKVVEKKSEQAEFTGIDDGNEETIIDLSIMPGMMKGWFGNVTGGGGHDIQNENHDARWQGSTMIGRFTDKTQLSIIGNGNNTNNRGFQDMAGDMMNSMRSSTGRGGGMMGGGGPGMWGGGSGITTSWMGGINGNGYVLKNDAMKLGGNYLYSGSDKYVEELSTKNTMVDEVESIETTNDQKSFNNTQGHRAGIEADWKISDKTSILFRPQFNYGSGDYVDSTLFSSTRKFQDDRDAVRINDGFSLSTGYNENWRTNGRLLYRQRIGEKKGRTISLNVNYSVSNNNMSGVNKSVTNLYDDYGMLTDSSIIDQQYTNSSENYSVNGRLSYTEPLGKNFYLEGSYRYGYNQTNSEKLTYNQDANGEYTALDTTYSSRYKNTFINQNAQINLMKQEEKYNVQVGFSVQPSSTKSITREFAKGTDKTLAYSVVNFSPSARFDYRFSDYKFIRVNYRGSTDQPSITQLQPVPDNSNPLYISLGNPKLQPEFTHNVWMDFRNTNMETYSSMNANLNLVYTKDDIITASWYDSDGIQYSAPINSSKGTYSARGRFMFNTPFGKSKFSVMSFTNLSVSSSLNYTGTGDVKTIEEIMDDLIVGRTTTLNVGESLNFVYRDDIFEARLGGRASYSTAWYTIKEQEKPDTWTNSVNAEFNATMPWGTEIKTDARYTFYIGFDEAYNKPQLVWNAEISQLLFKKKATIRFKVYDILNQARNVYRTTADNYVQDIQQNTLGQYFMISFTFRFGNFNNMAKGMGGGPGRGPGRGYGRPF